MRKKSSEHDAGSDGNYMTKQNLWLLQQMAEVLYKNVPHGELLPDWAESKINSAAEHIKSVAGWLMYERAHVGDEMYGRTPDESALRGKLVRLAHERPELRPHLLPLLHVAAVNHRKAMIMGLWKVYSAQLRGSGHARVEGGKHVVLMRPDGSATGDPTSLMKQGKDTVLEDLNDEKLKEIFLSKLPWLEKFASQWVSKNQETVEMAKD